jgi:hypothetical protein
VLKRNVLFLLLNLKDFNMAKPKLGSGARFKALATKLGKKKGVSDPKALAAVIGRKKYGNKKMAAMAAAGKKK